MQRSSNLYLIVFTSVLTVVCAASLAGLKMWLKPMHEVNEELDTKSKILSAVMPVNKNDGGILEKYEENIESILVDVDGNIVTDSDIAPEDVDIKKMFQETDPSKKLLPVFKFRSDVFEGQFEAYIIPMYGNGLWDAISGYVAVSGDYNSLAGAVFSHKAETPGLGARITDDEFRNRFVGKKIFDEAGTVQSIEVVKGEGNDIAGKDKPEHYVDGLSGASMTTGGVNVMLDTYFKLYQPYFANLQKEGASSSGAAEVKINRDIK